MATERVRTYVTALVTLAVLAVMAYGAITGTDTGVFEQYGAVVIGYWFGANAQSAVARATAGTNGNVPSVL